MLRNLNSGKIAIVCSLGSWDYLPRLLRDETRFACLFNLSLFREVPPRTPIPCLAALKRTLHIVLGFGFPYPLLLRVLAHRAILPLSVSCMKVPCRSAQRVFRAFFFFLVLGLAVPGAPASSAPPASLGIAVTIHNVDCDAGLDSGDCTTSSPCRTLAYAMMNADDGDIIEANGYCFAPDNSQTEALDAKGLTIRHRR